MTRRYRVAALAPARLPFLRPNRNAAPGGQKLHTLYRRQLALLSARDATQMNTTLPTQSAQFVIPVPGTTLDSSSARHWATDYYDFSGIPMLNLAGTAWT